MPEPGMGPSPPPSRAGRIGPIPVRSRGPRRPGVIRIDPGRNHGSMPGPRTRFPPVQPPFRYSRPTRGRRTPYRPGFHRASSSFSSLVSGGVLCVDHRRRDGVSPFPASAHPVQSLPTPTRDNVTLPELRDRPDSYPCVARDPRRRHVPELELVVASGPRSRVPAQAPGLTHPEIVGRFSDYPPVDFVKARSAYALERDVSSEEMDKLEAWRRAMGGRSDATVRGEGRP